MFLCIVLVLYAVVSYIRQCLPAWSLVARVRLLGGVEIGLINGTPVRV